VYYSLIMVWCLVSPPPMYAAVAPVLLSDVFSANSRYTQHAMLILLPLDCHFRFIFSS